MKIWLKLTWVFSIFFIVICLGHYLTPRPLWLDEQLVFDSISEYTYPQIFGPLKTQQAFPRVHLVVIKFFSGFFGYSIYALRFFSFLAMGGAFVLWMKLYRKHTDDFLMLCLLALSFAGSYRLTYYASELKPYAADVLAVAMFALFFGVQKDYADKSPDRRLYWMTGLLPLTIFFSYAGLFVFWMVVWNFGWMSRCNSRLWGVTALSVASSAVCFAVLYKVDLVHFMHVADYQSYWHQMFLGTDSAEAFFGPLWEGTRKIVTYWNGTNKQFIRWASGFVPLFMFAMIRDGFRTWRKDNFRLIHLEAIGLALFIELIVLSLMHKYPFTGARITLFMAPFAFYFILKGVRALRRWPVLERIFLCYYAVFSLVCLVNTIYVYIKVVLA